MELRITLCDACRSEIAEAWPTRLRLSEADAPEGVDDEADLCSLACLRDYVNTLITTA